MSETKQVSEKTLLKRKQFITAVFKKFGRKVVTGTELSQIRKELGLGPQTWFLTSEYRSHERGKYLLPEEMIIPDANP